MCEESLYLHVDVQDEERTVCVVTTSNVSVSDLIRYIEVTNFTDKCLSQLLEDRSIMFLFPSGIIMFQTSESSIIIMSHNQIITCFNLQ